MLSCMFSYICGKMIGFEMLTSGTTYVYYVALNVNEVRPSLNYMIVS